MTDVPTQVTVADTPVTPPVAPSPASRGWIATLVVGVALALVAGATAVLFVRVQDAQDRADEAVTIASSQDALVARLDELDASLAAVESTGVETSDDVARARDQVAALRRCVNAALDGVAQATLTSKPVSLTKC